MAQARNRHGETLLGWAAAEGGLEAVGWLLERGADLMAEQPGGLVPRQVGDPGGLRLRKAFARACARSCLGERGASPPKALINTS